MSKSLKQALLAHFDSVFSGPNGDYAAVMEALAGVTAAQAAWTSRPDPLLFLPAAPLDVMSVAAKGTRVIKPSR